MRQIDIDQVDYVLGTARVSIWRINKQTGAYQRNKYLINRGSVREERMMKVINSPNKWRTEWKNNQYNNYGEVLTIYYDRTNRNRNDIDNVIEDEKDTEETLEV